MDIAIMTEKEFYEKIKHPERVKVFNITRIRCECGRVVLLKGIRRHEKTASHNESVLTTH